MIIKIFFTVFSFFFSILIEKGKETKKKERKRERDIYDAKKWSGEIKRKNEK